MQLQREALQFHHFSYAERDRFIGLALIADHCRKKKKKEEEEILVKGAFLALKITVQEVDKKNRLAHTPKGEKIIILIKTKHSNK